MSKFKPQFKRLLYIDSRINSGDYPNCSRLAKDYEVSSRTIHRDIEYMRDMLDAPIEYNSSRRGYYYTEPNYRLPSIDIKESDFFAICIAEKALQQYENTPIYDKLSSIFYKLRDLLPDTIPVNTSWIDNRYSFIRESYTLIDPEIWETISLALRNQKQLIIKHKKVKTSNALKRIVNPYHIVSFNGEWYLIAYCNYRNSILKFAISRIKEVSITDSGFKIPDDFDYNLYMGSNFGIMTEEREYLVKIKFEAKLAPYICERTWHPTQIIKENRDGSIVFSFLTNSFLEVKQWVLSWGADAKVISPKILADRVKGSLQQALTKYK